MWAPTGYHGKRIGELGHHLALENEPYIDLAGRLRQHTFSGVMELHVFVLPFNPSADEQARFRADCTEHKIKCCFLRLDYVKAGFVGALESSRYVNGGMDVVWREAFKDARMFAAKGWPVIRTKIEATASIKGVPQTDEEARALPPFTYFEFHVRNATLPPAQDRP
jgi:hypothetical protein